MICPKIKDDATKVVDSIAKDMRQLFEGRLSIKAFQRNALIHLVSVKVDSYAELEGAASMVVRGNFTVTCDCMEVPCALAITMLENLPTFGQLELGPAVYQLDIVA